MDCSDFVIIAGIIYHFTNDFSYIKNSKIVEKEIVVESCKNFESLGAKLLSKQHLIPFYNKIHRILGLPGKDDIYSASKPLFLISKSAFGEDDDFYYKLDIYRKQVCEYCLIEDPIQDGETIESLKRQVAEVKKNKA